MEINYKKNTIEKDFELIPFGDCFLIVGILYMRIDKFHAFRFDAGAIDTFELGTKVEWINTVLTVG